MKSRTIIPALSACVVGSLVVTACGTFTNPGAPEQSFNIDQDIQDLEAEFKKKQVTIVGFYATPKADRLDKRNEFIGARLTLINIQYIKFIRRFAVEKAQLDSAIDITTIGVDLAVTLVGGESVKAILGAVSAGLTSTKVTIDKNFFQEKTVPVLITAMNAERKEALIPIFDGIGKSLDEYPFTRALSDLHVYYQAGTFIGALQAIQKDSGAKEEKADDKLAKFRVTVFGEDESGSKIRAFLRPPDGKPSNPVNRENLAKIRDWIDRSPIADLPIASFLANPQLKALRERAIQDLNIP